MGEHGTYDRSWTPDAVKAFLIQMETKALSVGLPATQAQPTDVQTTNMEADAELKRKAADSDDEWTDASECSDQKELREVQQAEKGEKTTGNLRILRKEKEKKAAKEKKQSSKGGGKGK